MRLVSGRNLGFAIVRDGEMYSQGLGIYGKCGKKYQCSDLDSPGRLMGALRGGLAQYGLRFLDNPKELP